MKSEWLDRKVPNHAALLYNVSCILVVSGTVAADWKQGLTAGMGASVLAVTVDRLIYEFKVAGDAS